MTKHSEAVVEHILAELSSPQEERRRKAVLMAAGRMDVRLVRRLLELVKVDPSQEVRFLARRVLMELQSRLADGAGGSGLAQRPSVVEQLFEGLFDRDPSVRLRTLLVVVQRRLSGALERLRRLETREKDPRIRAALALALGLLGGENEIPVLKAMLEEDDERIRCNAVEGLSLVRHPRALQCLLGALRHKGRVRNKAHQVLSRMERSRILQVVNAMFASRDAEARDCAAYAILKLQLHECVPLLELALDDPELAIRLKARNGLVLFARNGVEQALEILKRHAGERGEPEKYLTMSLIARPSADADEDTLLSSGAKLEIIGRIVEDGDVGRTNEVLRMLLSEEDAYVRAAAVLALGHLGASHLVETIRVYLNDPDRRVRANAVEALGLIGTERAVAGLDRYLHSDDNRIRANAVVAVGRSRGVEEVRSVVEDMVSSADSMMKRSAIYAVTELREPSLIGLLEPLLQDESSTVRRKAADAAAILGNEA